MGGTPQDYGRRFEREMFKRFESLGARKTPSSGSQWYSKGDLIIPPFLVECKATEKESKILHFSELAKIRKESLEQKLDHALLFTLVSLNHVYAIIPVHWFEHLIREAQNGV